MKSAGYPRRKFFEYSGLGAIVLLRNPGIVLAGDEFNENFREFKAYLNPLMKELQDEKSKSKAPPGTSFWRRVYDGILKGKKVEINLGVTVDAPNFEYAAPRLEMIVTHENPSPQASNLTTWQGGRGLHRYHDDGIKGHLMHDDTSFSIFEESLMEDLYYSDSWGYIFERLSLAKPNEKCPQSEVGPGYCVVARVSWDSDTEKIDKEGSYYANVKHEDLLDKVAKNRIKANTQYKELLIGVVKTLKKTGKIPK